MSNPNPPTVDPAQLQQAVTEVRQTTPQQGIPLEVKLPTGQIYRGTTPQEVLDQLVQAQTEASQLIKQQKDQLRDMEARIAEYTAPKPSETDAAHQKKIADRYTTWAQNPTEATRQDLADLLGVPADKVVDVLKGAITNSTVSAATEEFMNRVPNFPNNPQTAALMNETLRRRFGSGMEAATADNLELAYNELVRTGRINPDPMQASGVNNPYQAIPSLRGSTAPQNPVNDMLRQFGEMNLEQMKSVIEKYAAMNPGQR